MALQPSEVMAMAFIAAEWPFMVCRQCPVGTYQCLGGKDLDNADSLSLMYWYKIDTCMWYIVAAQLQIWPMCPHPPNNSVEL